MWMGAEGRDVWEEAGGSARCGAVPAPVHMQITCIDAEGGNAAQPSTHGHISALPALLCRGAGQQEVLSGCESSSPAWIWQRFHSTLWQRRRAVPWWSVRLAQWDDCKS